MTERLRKRWEREADKGSAVDVQQDLMRYTVDVTTNLAFGYDMNTLENEEDVIQDHLEKIFPAINRRITVWLTPNAAAACSTVSQATPFS